MVPKALRTWFVVHFIADIIFAIPLLVAPTAFLTFLGWPTVDPISSRLVGAALVGIGVESWIGRNQDAEGFLTMLRLKVMWSATATLGILVSMLQGGPLMGWAFFAVFAVFNIIWVYWFVTLRKLQTSP